MKTLYIISGCNGAGKTTASVTILPEIFNCKVQLLYFWLPSPEYAIARVAQRVKEGGHNIPTDVIRRRYHAGIKNLFEIYLPKVDNWILVDNSKNPREIIAEDNVIYNNQSFSKLRNYGSER